MRIDFDVIKFAEALLPYHKRQENRIALFTWPLKLIEELFGDYQAFRQRMYYLVNLYGQKLSLEAILNKEVEGATINGQKGISIIDNDPGGIWLSSAAENTDSIDLGDAITEPTEFEYIPALGDEFLDLLVNFKVLAPSTSDFTKISELIEKYKLAGFTWEIEGYTPPDIWGDLTADSEAATADNAEYTV